MLAGQAGGCPPREREACRAEFGDNLDWACSKCPKGRPGDPRLHPYTRKLLTVHSLQEVGYPLAADDLSLEEWLDLARLKRALKTKANHACPLIPAS